VIATIITFATCPACGYRNSGIDTGTARPTMRTLTFQRTLGWRPRACGECTHPLHVDLYEASHLNAETTARLDAWRDRQRRRNTERAEARAAERRRKAGAA
jgi:hypothetical protein